MLATPNVDRVRNRFLERTGGAVAEGGEVESPYLDEHVTDWCKRAPNKTPFAAGMKAPPYVGYFEKYFVKKDTTLYRYFTNIENQESVTTNFEALYSRKESATQQCYWEKMEYMAGLVRLGVNFFALFSLMSASRWDSDSLLLWPRASCIDHFFNEYTEERDPRNYWIPDSSSSNADQRPVTSTSPFLAYRELKSPFTPSMCVEHGLEEGTPFIWPVIEMAEFERSQRDSAWHRKVLIIRGIKLANFELIGWIRPERESIQTLKNFCADKLFSLLSLQVTKVSVTVDSLGLRDCIFISFSTEREAEIAQKAIDEVRLPLREGEKTYSRVRARLFHHHNREADDVREDRKKKDGEGEVRAGDNVQLSGNETPPATTSKSRGRGRGRRGRRKKTGVPAAGDDGDDDDDDDDDALAQEEEMKSKASRSLPSTLAITPDRLHNDLRRQEKRLASKEAEVSESNALLEQLRYRLSATELVNEKLRHSAMNRQDELLAQLTSLQRQLRDSAANEREMAGRYNALLARTDDEREDYERRVRDAGSGLESSELVRGLMRREVSQWVDEATQGSGDALLGRYEQDLKMVLAKISIAREELLSREQAGGQAGGNNLCLLCMENPKTHLLLPCRHLVYCQSCFNRASQSVYDPYTNPHGDSQGIDSCPVCRAPVRDHMHVYN